MSLSSLVRSTIINGANSLAVAVQEGIIYRLQPVEEMTPIIFTGFTANRHKIINLSEVLDQDYRIAGMTLDIPDDDEEEAGDFETSSRSISTTAYVRVVKRDKSAENIRVIFNSYPQYINPLYIDHNDVWKVKFSRDVNKITFRCVPAIINKPKIFS